jgi:hypothetical protein
MDTDEPMAPAPLPRHSSIEPAGFSPHTGFMGKTKIPATGEGYLGEIMVHRLTRAVGVVENVIEAKAGWAPQPALKLKDGSVKKGKLSDFREPSATERENFSAA